MNWLTFWKRADAAREGRPIANPLLPEPTRPAPPMPKVKPPKLDIGEPALKLLEMLKQDVWEARPSQLNRSHYSFLNFYYLAHVYDESLEFSYSIDKDHYSKVTEIKLSLEWPTEDERDAILRAAQKRYTETLMLNEKHKKEALREKFANQIKGL